MEYIAVYTAMIDHPKALALSDRQFRALIGAWLYAGRHDTAGHVPEAAAPVIRMAPATAVALERAGWLHRNGSGWEIHDWAEHQESLAKAIRLRDAARARKRRERAGGA